MELGFEPTTLARSRDLTTKPPPPLYMMRLAFIHSHGKAGSVLTPYGNMTSPARHWFFMSCCIMTSYSRQVTTHEATGVYNFDYVVLPLIENLSIVELRWRVVFEKVRHSSSLPFLPF
ncbi:hypothetical protein AVEN_174945-1 [Araneus ventricosus]|uniref:Uncharacterized protein n=1 Tax=Araneus ventricosus TaxID=182803 RepID=A0A4Y2PJ44_ARAVE|nr:hypothetical protein AVEN_49855-1 [Araneus ventricosus]GBN50075.1 hypothetical protein AVEN_140564-1 [Araneus ventricosus]GBN50086.1 hypothetical protein AVEN_160975-1 [Araneus ventricosus]GBN50092.1 hypothetical protein AVEN_174945-1 [Araneus ventricosus]